MEASNVQPAQVMRRADQLIVGDRIDAEYLPFIATSAEVIFVRVHEYRRQRQTFVAFIQDDGFIDSTGYEADAKIRIVPAANPPGLDFSREPDDPTPVSGGRVQPHYADGNTGVDLDGPVCQGVPAGFEAGCGTAGPHGPHALEALSGASDRLRAKGCLGPFGQTCICRAA